MSAFQHRSNHVPTSVPSNHNPYTRRVVGNPSNHLPGSGYRARARRKRVVASDRAPSGRPAMTAAPHRVYDHRAASANRQGRCNTRADASIVPPAGTRGPGLAYKRETGITSARSALLPVDIPLRGASVGALASDRR